MTAEIHALATPRMGLRPLHLDHGPALHQLWTLPEVREFLWDGEVIPFETTESTLRQNRQRFLDHGHGIWGLWPKDDGALFGFAGFWHFHRPEVLELFYGLHPDSWGGGLATEVAAALSRYAFDELGFEVVHAATDAPHVASRRVLEKVGFRQTERTVVDGLDTRFFELEPEACPAVEVSWRPSAAFSAP